MFKLIENELIKIFKRKNIYILLIIGLVIILCQNIYCKLLNSDYDITYLYEQAYKQDLLKLEQYDNLLKKENYSDIEERVKLEKYALENNIKYNILLNSNNTNLPVDARIALMRFFNNFDIIIIFIVIYVATTILSEEYNKGTIKNLLTKPHKRVSIILSKIITCILIVIIITILIIIFQYLIGGAIFGFDSYSLEAIRINQETKEIETMNLYKYILLISIDKIQMYIIISLIGVLISNITNNISINILILLGIYIASKMIEVTIQPIVVTTICVIVIFLLTFIIFSKKDIKNT